MNQNILLHLNDPIGPHGCCVADSAFAFVYTSETFAFDAQTVEDADELARNAFSIYRGLNSKDSFFSCGDKSVRLPWLDDYVVGQTLGSDLKLVEVEISKAVSKILPMYGAGISLKEYLTVFCPNSYPKELKKSVQLLAVATLVALDRCVEFVLTRNLIEARVWLAWAGKMFQEAMCNVAILVHRRDMAQAGAIASHAGDRAQKVKVFAWLDENFAKWKSKDQAAMRILDDKVGAVAFRTARSWIDEWDKQRSAGRQ